MSEFLTLEKAHAATDGEHGDNWQGEMVCLKGALVSDADL
jgi:hypothetical protein